MNEADKLLNIVLHTVCQIKSKETSHTYFSSCAFIIQGTKGDGRQQNCDVEENGSGGVLQERAVTSSYTCWDYTKCY